MGFFSALFGSSAPPVGKFSFADGRVVTAKEFGFLSANQFVLQPATELLGQLFQSPELGAPFPIAGAVNASPAIAHIYLIAFHTGIYLAYAKEVLKLDEATKADMGIGIKDAVDRMLTPSRTPMPEDMKKSVIGAGQSFCAAIVADIDEAQTMDPRVVRPLLACNSSKLLLSYIEQSYVHPRPSPSELLSGIGAQHTMRVSFLDDVPVKTLRFLRDDLRIRVV